MQDILNWFNNSDNIKILLGSGGLIGLTVLVSLLYEILANVRDNSVEYGLDDLEKQSKTRISFALGNSLRMTLPGVVVGIISTFLPIIFNYIGVKDDGIMNLSFFTLIAIYLIFAIISLLFIYTRFFIICIFVCLLVLVPMSNNICRGIIVLITSFLIIYLLYNKKVAIMRKSRVNEGKFCFYKTIGLTFIFVALVLSIITILPNLSNSSDEKQDNNKSIYNNSSILYMYKSGLWKNKKQDSISNKIMLSQNTQSDTENINDNSSVLQVFYNTTYDNTTLSDITKYNNYISLYLIILTIIFFITIFIIHITYYNKMPSIAFIYYKKNNKENVYIYKKINNQFLCGNKDYIKWDKKDFDKKIKNIKSELKKYIYYKSEIYKNLENQIDELSKHSGYIRVDVDYGKRSFDRLEMYIENHNNELLGILNQELSKMISEFEKIKEAKDFDKKKFKKRIKKIEQYGGIKPLYNKWYNDIKRLIFYKKKNKSKQYKDIKSQINRLKKYKGYISADIGYGKKCFDALDEYIENEKFRIFSQLNGKLYAMIRTFEELRALKLVNADEIANVQIYPVLNDYQTDHFEIKY